jgi:hypothetical protein
LFQPRGSGYTKPKMIATKAGSAGPLDAGRRVRRLLAAFDRPATPLFVALTIGFGWLFWFSLWHVNYADFVQCCNHDSGAALRADEIVALGQRPAIDFFYYYGPLPILLGRAFFTLFGRSPLGLMALLAVIGMGFAAGLASIVHSLSPTRLGVILVALAITHAIAPPVPTHALEAALLIWVVALRIRGHRTAATALASCTLFVKISMGSVLLAGLVVLALLDAIRDRNTRSLWSLLAIPCALALSFFGCSLALGRASVAASFDPRVGAALYRAADLGFLREGRYFWYPAGHTLGWYFGGLAGPWIVGSAVLFALGSGAAVRIFRGTFRENPRTAATKADELYAIASVANLAFIAVFFGPSSGVYYYSWLPLVGVTPLLAKAHWGAGRGEARPWTRYGWLAVAAFLLLSTKSTIAQCVSSLRQPHVWVGSTSMSAERANELKRSLALAHSIGGGVVTVVARVANFGIVDPKLRQGRYWMMQAGMRATPSVAELVSMARSSDALFMTKSDYPGMVRIPEFQSFLINAEHLYDGKYFLVLRPASASSL